MSDDIPYYERPDTIEDDDIVERLRRYTVACRCKGCLTKIAAADEIERLRAELDAREAVIEAARAWVTKWDDEGVEQELAAAVVELDALEQQ